MEKNQLINQITEIIDNSGVTFGEVKDALNYLIATYADKANNLLNGVNIKEITQQDRFRY